MIGLIDVSSMLPAGQSEQYLARYVTGIAFLDFVDFAIPSPIIIPRGMLHLKVVAR